MSDSKRRSEGGSSERRNLPSWMSSKDNENKSHGKKAAATSAEDEESKLMEGVVFVLSGFVNPERATWRSQALEMGAEYRPDWTSDCTLLVCAYSNTPKSRQVEADCGTIVKKEWILECFSQKKLVEIDSYLMHAGKPWRKSKISHERGSDQKASPPRKSEKQVKSRSHSKPTASTSYKPEPSEIKQIASEGILICLQDAIDFLEQNQDVRKITDQWNVIPHAVEEIVKLVDAGNASPSLPREDLCRKARACKEIYEAELGSLDGSKSKEQRLKTDESGRSGNRTNAVTAGAAEYDSDETIEMTGGNRDCVQYRCL